MREDEIRHLDEEELIGKVGNIKCNLGYSHYTKEAK